VARIVLASNLNPFAGGTTELTLEVDDVYRLFQALAARFPALEPHLEHEVAVAIDGEIYQDVLFQPIGPDSEVILIQKIAGG